MIARRYGTRIHSVQPNFDAHALTEISFRQTTALRLPADEFSATYERVGERQLTAESEGDVKAEAEQALLISLGEQLETLEAELGGEHVLLVENEPGRDYPKTRDRTTERVVAGVNRLHFAWRVDPPLKLGIYRRKAG